VSKILRLLDLSFEAWATLDHSFHERLAGDLYEAIEDVRKENLQKFNDGTIDKQGEVIVFLRNENKELSELIFDLRGENYALRERVANLEKMITRSA